MNYREMGGVPVVLMTVSGSRAYGIEHSESDIDVKGACFGPVASYTGYRTRFEQTEHIGEAFSEAAAGTSWLAVAEAHGVEGTLYELRKFFKLAAECNPNVWESVWSDDRFVLAESSAGARLREARELFLSAKAKYTFCGYARSQLGRIETHRAWLLNPPKSQPIRGDFDLPERTLLPKAELLALRAAVEKKLDEWEPDLGDLEPSRRTQLRAKFDLALTEVATTKDDLWIHAARSVGIGDDLIEVMGRERRYQRAARYWQQYQGWVKGRNAERAELEAHYGYDVKHGAHLYRLLTMGLEIVRDGEVHVDRRGRDAELIKEIRRGAWSYEEIVTWAKATHSEVDETYRAMYKTKTMPPVIPEVPDTDALDALCCELVVEYLGQA
ncbi:MAG: putative nucleotidyltransferase [Bradymonadia bacterium]|jgi:predicted nucleotidyltransferase